MAIEERERHMKENRCFNCHNIGHRAKDCQKKTPQKAILPVTKENPIIKNVLSNTKKRKPQILHVT